jgi:GTP-binding protein Era
MSAAEHKSHRCGTVAIVGRPNVGKSTLLNALVGQKLSITSRKPQTTRHRVTGVLSRPGVQYVFVDTPGFQTLHGGPLNRALNRAVRAALEGVDAVLFVVQAGRLEDADRVVQRLLPQRVPVVLVANKSDRVGGPERMLPFLKSMGEASEFAAIVPVSAARGRGLGELLKVLAPLLPEQPPMFDEETLTDRSERFLAAELVREKLFRLLGEEVPYGAAVTIDQFREEGRLRHIHASIVVDKENHKAIIVGKGGMKLKAIASAARRDMEKLLGGKVFLEVWVKVRGGWTEDAASLRRLGIEHVSRGRIDREAAFVLRVSVLGTKLLVEAFSRTHGRLPRRQGRAPAGLVAPRLLAFQPLTIAWSGAGCAHARALRVARRASAAPWRGAALRFYVNELLLRLLPREDLTTIFDQYALAVAQLARGVAGGPVLRAFERRFLQ